MATHLIDSNVLLDVAEDDLRWIAWSQAALGHAVTAGGAAINPLILAEVSAGYDTIEALDAALPETELTRLALPWEAAFLAGKAFVAYRREGGTRRSPMPDFYIGAHAAISGLTLVTRDPRRYRRHFPRLKLIAPDTHFGGLVPVG
jgi:predicted nucleic acid-binding protein